MCFQDMLWTDVNPCLHKKVEQMNALSIVVRVVFNYKS